MSPGRPGLASGLLKILIQAVLCFSSVWGKLPNQVSDKVSEASSVGSGVWPSLPGGGGGW